MLQAALERFLDRQYRRPDGLAGQFIARRMARQHQPENAWTVSLLTLQPADRVLEVGFGPGVAIQMAAAQVPQGLVVGIDYSPTMVSVARRRNARAVRAGRVELRHGEATRLPFADDMFDKAFTIHTLYFWKEPGQALQELRRVLKPAGKLVLTFLARDRWPGDEPAETIAGVYTGQEVAHLMLEAGFARTYVDEGPQEKPFREIAVVAIK
jgi:ubiquinone/menaquinone biosynthesis C-methylase UbiE